MRIVGIDAMNLGSGGAITHLRQMLAASDPVRNQFERVVLWAPKTVSDHLAPAFWLKVVTPEVNPRNVIQREYWRARHLAKLARSEGCDIVFSPGGSPVFNFSPWVSMSQNMLPFEKLGVKSHSGKRRLRFALLRKVQSFSFTHADGVIFISQHGLDVVNEALGAVPRSRMVRFGINISSNEKSSPKPQLNPTVGFNWLYVSAIDFYKGHLELIDAVAILRARGESLTLHLVGSGPDDEVSIVREAIRTTCPDGIVWHGQVPVDQVKLRLTDSDGFVFVSHCENLPNAVIEAVGVGLPVVAAQIAPCLEVLAGAARFCSVGDAHSIALGLKEVMDNPVDWANKSIERRSELQSWTWDKCADETFSFLDEVVSSLK